MLVGVQCPTTEETAFAVGFGGCLKVSNELIRNFTHLWQGINHIGRWFSNVRDTSAGSDDNSVITE